jgi:hypothetical protein
VQELAGHASLVVGDDQRYIHGDTDAKRKVGGPGGWMIGGVWSVLRGDEWGGTPYRRPNSPASRLISVIRLRRFAASPWSHSTRAAPIHGSQSSRSPLPRGVFTQRRSFNAAAMPCRDVTHVARKSAMIRA